MNTLTGGSDLQGNIALGSDMEQQPKINPQVQQ